MSERTKGFLRIGEEIEWRCGNLVCVKKKNGKYRLALENPRSVLKNKENRWIFKEEFEYISEPEEYVSIIRYSDKSRLINLLRGIYLTNEMMYIKERIEENRYRVIDLNKDKEITFRLNNKRMD